MIPNVLYFTHGIVIKKFGSNGIKLPPEQHCKASQSHRVQEVKSSQESSWSHLFVDNIDNVYNRLSQLTYEKYFLDISY